MRWFVLFCACLFCACAPAAPTQTLTPLPTATQIPPPPAPPLTANILPDATTTFKQVAGRAPFTVTFTANVSGGTPPYQFAWDFDGDNKTDSAEKFPPSVVYKKTFAQNAALVVTDAQGQQTRALRRIVAFASPKAPAWKYGVTARWERRRAPYYPTLQDVERAAQLLKDAGAQAVRLDFDWDLLNPTRDEWKFDDYDAVVRSARKNNLEILGVLAYSSWWASSAQNSNDWRERLYTAPQSDYAYARFTYEIVKHFKNDVRAWQIWNEPNSQEFWKPQPNSARYASLLQEAYLAAKYADPDAFVVFGGLSGNGVEGSDDAHLANNFMAQAYAAGARGYFDAMAIHPYLLPNSGINTLREKIANARAVMNANGDANIPLWLTEIGVPTDVPWWQTAPVQSEQDAVRWLNLVYTKLWDLTPVIVWYQLQDRATGDDADAHFGLLRADFSYKPAYDALRALTSSR